MAEFDNPVRCELIYTTKAGITTQYKLTDLDGKVLPDNEQIDIGQKKWPYHWSKEKKTLTWGLVNFTEDIEKEYWQQRIWATVFRTFGWLTPRKYRFNPDFESADFRIAHIMRSDVFSSTNVLAHAYLYFNNSTKNGVIEFNDKNHFFTPLGKPTSAYLVDRVNYPDPNTPIMLRTQPLLQIGMHEVYHSHGARHDLVNPNSLMAPYVKPGYGRDDKVIKENFVWHSRDIQRLQEFEGKRFFPIRWLNYFRLRRVKESEYYR